MTCVTPSLHQSIVVFSQNYLPVSYVALRRAVVLLVTGKAEPLTWFDETAAVLRSPRQTLRVPAHIRLTQRAPERVWKLPAVNRREVLRRDRHTCQYCGSKSHLTLDHVVPRSKGGQHTWDNVVTACEACNSRKGDRPPEQVGLHLRTPPKAPIHPAVAFADRFWRDRQPR
ncbi:MAG: HNH endonuclease [Spirulinaceae cyanobacterium SM2_1_0]|nr:HNH endonuclease [Spirulinaceae cyanobacterium SM2_1_0]